ncbi:ATP-dependent DNA ligase [Streptomyces sp. NPDC127068]|uniref:ATP-dependent DNA ligase n=1 Tax=Streptomyces sp. NPDC127068 TaxID=3347127 RepID=UPI0036482BBD
MLLARLAQVSRDVGATSARTRKVALLAELFRETEPQDAPVVVTYLAGRLPQGRIGVGWSVLRDRVAPAAEPLLTVRAVDSALTSLAAVSGTGARATRARLVGELFGAATEEEQRFLRGLLSGEVRQGALDALAVEGLAGATATPPQAVRRAVMLAGSLPDVAGALLSDGPGALDAFRLTVGRPVLPMLAGSAPSAGAAVDRLGGPCAVEEKLDGIRVQVHRDGDTVRVFTRTLDEITDRLPELVSLVLELPGERFILDGEVLALGADGRPRSFQETAGRVGSRADVASAARSVPLSPVFFDALAVDGRELLDLPLERRHEELARLVPAAARVRRTVVDPGPDGGSPARAAAQAFLTAALDRGQEGVVVKALSAPYSAGRRGASWLKVKPVHTLDLVVLAAEWGHGRRTGKLSNLHLGARRPDGTFAMLGKTFKGLTDEMLAWQTAHLSGIAVSDDGFVVTVRPETVVEVAFDGLQRSSRYPAGVTLRFARVVRYREDKSADQADTVESVLAVAGTPAGRGPEA